MQLMSLRCPNCNGPLKMVNEGTFYCANCDSSFMADYDKDDVEYQKMKTEAEIRKQQLDQAQSSQAERAQAAKSVFRRKMIALAIVMTVVLTIIIPTVIGTLRVQKRVAEERRQQEIEREAKREQEEKEKEKEEKRRQEEEARLAKEEAERQAKLASYRLSPEEITSDAFFVENANQALYGQIWDNTDLFWTNWVWNEDPEYITSYLLIAKDENKRDQNIMCNIYKVHWDKEFDDETQHYVMYDAACLTNISRNEDGTINSDYDPDSLSYHSELIANQFLSGYTEYDQLIRQEIYGNSDYDYVEFKMPGYEDIEE